MLFRSDHLSFRRSSQLTIFASSTYIVRINIYSYVSFNKFLSNFEPKSAFPNISQDPFNNLPRTFPRILHITISHIGSFLNAGPSGYHCIYEATNQIGIRASSVTTITAQGTQKTFLYIYSTMSMVRLNDKRKDIT